MPDLSSKTDEQLVQLSIKSSDYFIYLVDRYEKKLLRYIQRLLNIDASEAEDVLQNTFIKIYKNLNAFDPDLKFSSWAYRIAHNESINYLNKHKKNQPIPLENSEEEGQLMDILKSEINLPKELKAKELSAQVRSWVDQLPIHYKEVLILHFLEEKTYSEISDILKKPMGTIATLINRGKAQLKNIIEKSNYLF